MPPSDITYCINSLNAELNPIRHLLAMVGARHIVHFSRIRVKHFKPYIAATFQTAHQFISLRGKLGSYDHMTLCMSSLLIVIKINFNNC